MNDWTQPLTTATASGPTLARPWLVADIGGTNARFGWLAEGVDDVAHVTTLVGSAYDGPAAAAGAYLAAPGDINGDGKDDLIVGAPTANTNAGKIYVIYGTAAALPADVNFNAVESTIAGEVFLGTPGFAAGPVSGVGKFSNVDTAPDFIIASESGQGAYLITVQSSVFKNGFEN